MYGPLGSGSRLRAYASRRSRAQEAFRMLGAAQRLDSATSLTAGRPHSSCLGHVLCVRVRVCQTQEFHPYVFQIFAQLIELRPAPLPQVGATGLPSALPCLRPVPPATPLLFASDPHATTGAPEPRPCPGWDVALRPARATVSLAACRCPPIHRSTWPSFLRCCHPCSGSAPATCPRSYGCCR